jgi:predicted phosphohydrolase
MALYAIGDLHLSLGSDKPMDVFSGWDNYIERIRDGFAQLSTEDTCVICGDVSWGMTLEACTQDFSYIASLPGKKIILKGNHDYWWSTASKMYVFFERNGFSGIELLNNNCFYVEDGKGGKTAVCGTRGWFFEEETGSAHDKKILAREILRLEASLNAARDASEKIVFLHYPPVYKNYICPEIISVMKKHAVKSCWYGHLHSHGHRAAVTGLHDGIDYHLVSADYVGFRPVKVLG